MRNPSPDRRVGLNHKHRGQLLEDADDVFDRLAIVQSGLSVRKAVDADRSLAFSYFVLLDMLRLNSTGGDRPAAFASSPRSP